ncbi:sulfurtransferase complex subunit TusD [Gallaecimonas kandeliae]|uniref:sulfurtransferase complex subunit TusD n=1 Tax=Gallaecimonas kandeliae TaxID=3029055 RepID=UPI002648323A|nr:sulfurtransferase complex subunit TusD [Gallaecimonas kandeliae]WKE67270.1 sulfurtransferase complex subunit TusD [Gallaecimonas kandeliae]
MATFTLLITDDPWAGLAFAEAALAEGHALARIFFYGEAVRTANGMVPQIGDEPHVGKAWADFAKAQGLELAVCVAAAERRGILDAEQAEEAELAPAMAAPFCQAGLGELITASAASERTVQW